MAVYLDEHYYKEVLSMVHDGNQTRLLDAMLHSLFVLNEDMPESMFHQSRIDRSPHYSSSVDDALKLIPPGVALWGGQAGHFGHWAFELRCHNDNKLVPLGQSNGPTMCAAIIGAVMDMYETDMNWGGHVMTDHLLPFFYEHFDDLSQEKIDFLFQNVVGKVRRGAMVKHDPAVVGNIIYWGLRFEEEQDMVLFKLKYHKGKRHAA